MLVMIVMIAMVLVITRYQPALATEWLACQPRRPPPPRPLNRPEQLGDHNDLGGHDGLGDHDGLGLLDHGDYDSSDSTNLAGFGDAMPEPEFSATDLLV